MIQGRANGIAPPTWVTERLSQDPGAFEFRRAWKSKVRGGPGDAWGGWRLGGTFVHHLEPGGHGRRAHRYVERAHYRGPVQ